MRLTAEERSIIAKRRAIERSRQKAMARETRRRIAAEAAAATEAAAAEARTRKLLERLLGRTLLAVHPLDGNYGNGCVLRLSGGALFTIYGAGGDETTHTDFTIETDLDEKQSCNPLASIAGAMLLLPHDWSGHPRMAWIYGVAVGWSDFALADLARVHDWTPEQVALLRRQREQYAALTKALGQRQPK